MNPAFAHAVGAAVMTLAIGWLHPVAGYAVAVTYYFSREQNQFQTALARSKGVTRSSLWYRGWLPFEWSRQQQIEFYAPLVSSTAVFLTLTSWGG